MYTEQNHRTVPKSFFRSQLHLWVKAYVGVWSERHTTKSRAHALEPRISYCIVESARESRRALRQDLLIEQDVRGHAHEAGAMELGAVSILSDYVKSLKVADLKEHIKAFNERLPFCPHMRLSGNKTELAQRLTEAVLASCMNPQNFQEMLCVIAPLGYTCWSSDQDRLRRAANQYTSFYGRSPANGEAPPSLSILGVPASGSFESFTASSNARVNAGSASSTNSASTSTAPKSLTPNSLKQLRFWPSPFYEVQEFVSSIVQVPEAPPASGRRQVGVSFTLSEKQVDRLLDTQYVSTVPTGLR